MAATPLHTRGRIDQTATALIDLATDARARFGSLTHGQLNWKPEPDRWSVAQCFDHLTTVDALYLPLFRRLATGAPKPTAWERFSPFSRLLGRLLISSLDPTNPRRTKTASKTQPSASDIGGDVITRFAEHQLELAESLRALPHDLDLRTTIVTSPLSSIVTYSLDDCLGILVVHGRRHFGQAERVTTSAGFPA